MLARGGAYQTEAPTLWDVDFQTAVAQAELEDRERPGAMHRVRFALAEDDSGGGGGGGAAGTQQGEGSAGGATGAAFPGGAASPASATSASATPAERHPASATPASATPAGAALEALIETTRPELIPACVALLAHPDDTRQSALVGREVLTPLFGTRVPVLTHPLVDPEKGTGLVMVCTFGDLTDVVWWRELGLGVRSVLAPDGRLAEVPWGERGWESEDLEGARASLRGIARQDRQPGAQADRRAARRSPASWSASRPR